MTESILEPFVHGMQPTVAVAEDAQIHDNDHEEDVRPTSIKCAAASTIALPTNFRMC